jgi:hypothetical protein
MIRIIEAYCVIGPMKTNLTECYTYFVAFESSLLIACVLFDCALQLNLKHMHVRIDKPMFDIVREISVLGNEKVDQNKVIA